MPNHRLKGLGVRGDVERIDDRNKHACIGYLRGVSPVAADDAANGGAHFLGIFESAH